MLENNPLPRTRSSSRPGVRMPTPTAARPGLMLLLCATGLLAGCASNGSKIDPWQKTNRVFYDFDNNLDKYVLKPMADAYVKVVPQPVRHSVNNAFDNLGYMNVI